ncbi:hypothetical protein D3C76_1131870 [compost metagenome]
MATCRADAAIQTPFLPVEAQRVAEGAQWHQEFPVCNMEAFLEALYLSWSSLLLRKFDPLHV